MSVKLIKLYIKAKRKIHDKLGCILHSSYSSQPHGLLVVPSQILTPPHSHSPQFILQPHKKLRGFLIIILGRNYLL
jgi:hypothetical protein